MCLIPGCVCGFKTKIRFLTLLDGFDTYVISYTFRVSIECRRRCVSINSVKYYSSVNSFLCRSFFHIVIQHALSPNNKNKKRAPVKNQSAALYEASSTAAVCIKKDTRVTESWSGLLKEYLNASYETSIRPFRETNTCKDMIFYEWFNCYIFRFLNFGMTGSLFTGNPMPSLI